MREAQKFWKGGKGGGKRKEKICVFKCSVLATVPTCLLPLFGSRLYPPRLYTKRRRRRRSPPARPIRPGRAILYEGPFWAAIAAQKGPE